MESSTSSRLPPPSSAGAASTSSSSIHAKLFVGGIPREATEESLKEHFIEYGRVVSANVIRNKDTGRSKGYGFVEFGDSDSAGRALADPKGHVILNQKVHVNLARWRDQNHTNQHQDQNSNTIGFHRWTLLDPKKIFVGGLPPNLTKDEFSEYFGYFGTISEAVVMHDPLGQPRGFGFIKYDSEKAVQKVLQNRFYQLKDKKVEVKMAIPECAYNHNKDRISNSSNGIYTDVGGGYAFGNYQSSFCPMYYPSYAGSQSYADHTSFHGGYITGYYTCISYSFVPAYCWSPLDNEGLAMPFGNTSSYPGYTSSYPGQVGYMNLPSGYTSSCPGYTSSYPGQVGHMSVPSGYTSSYPGQVGYMSLPSCYNGVENKEQNVPQAPNFDDAARPEPDGRDKAPQPDTNDAKAPQPDTTDAAPQQEEDKKQTF